MGIDVVEITERPESTVRFALTDGETTLLDSLADTPDSRQLWFARFWAAKEAVGKAEGTGLDGDPRRFVITAATPEEITVAVSARRYQVANRIVENPDDLPSRRYVVAWTWGSGARPTDASHTWSPTKRYSPMNASHAAILSEIAEMVRGVRDDLDAEVTMDATFRDDLGFESIEIVALAGRLQARYGSSVNLAQFVAGLDLTSIRDLRIGDLVDFIAAGLGPPVPA